MGKGGGLASHCQAPRRVSLAGNCSPTHTIKGVEINFGGEQSRKGSSSHQSWTGRGEYALTSSLKHGQWVSPTAPRAGSS